MSRKHIVILHYKLLDSTFMGGVEIVIDRQVRQMVKFGFKVTLISGTGQPKIRGVKVINNPLFDSRGTEIDCIQKELNNGNVPPQFDDLVNRTAWELEKVIPKGAIVIVHNIMTLTKNIALTVALKSVYQSGHISKLISWTHDLAWHDPVMEKQLHPGYPWDVIQQPWLNVNYICVSTENQGFIQTDFPQYNVPFHVGTVYNGIDPIKFNNYSPVTVKILEALKARGTDLSEMQLSLYLPMRLTRRKRVENGIKVIAELNKLKEFGGNVVYLISGALGQHNPDNVQYRKELDQLIIELGLQERVFFLEDIIHNDLGMTGHLPDEVIADMYKVSDALFLPTEREGFGLPLIEAGLARIPIFATNLDVFREIAGDLFYAIPAPLWEEKHLPDVAKLILQSLVLNKQYLWAVKVRQLYIMDKIFQQQILPLLEADIF